MGWRTAVDLRGRQTFGIIGHLPSPHWDTDSRKTTGKKQKCMFLNFESKPLPTYDDVNIRSEVKTPDPLSRCAPALVGSAPMAQMRE